MNNTGLFTSYGYYYIILETKIQSFLPEMQKNGMKCKNISYYALFMQNMEIMN